MKSQYLAMVQERDRITSFLKEVERLAEYTFTYQTLVEHYDSRGEPSSYFQDVAQVKDIRTKPILVEYHLLTQALIKEAKNGSYLKLRALDQAKRHQGSQG